MSKMTAAETLTDIQKEARFSISNTTYSAPRQQGETFGTATTALANYGACDEALGLGLVNQQELLEQP